MKHATMILLATLASSTIPSIPSGALSGATFHVSPAGDDTKAGTAAAPFRTLERAREAVRAARAAAGEDMEVILTGGVHLLERTWILDARDAGPPGHKVVCRARAGEAPVVSGGRAITGWEPVPGKPWWKARTDLADFRDLYVNGRRAQRARGAPFPGLELAGEHGYRTAFTDATRWSRPDDLELWYQVVWCHTMCKVSAIAMDGDRAAVTMLEPWFTLARTKEGVQVALPATMENAMELLDEPGEWYLERESRSVHYIPRQGEDLRSVEVVAPAVECLLRLEGTPERPVERIEFRGLAFAHSSWLEPSRIGHVDVQANFTMPAKRRFERDGKTTVIHNENRKSPAAVACRFARGVRFEGCVFTRLGGAGLDLEQGSQENAVAGCVFSDIAGSGIQIGGVERDDHHPQDPRRVVRDNEVSNNLIENVAMIYRGGVGIFAGYTEGTRIVHNEIRNLSYTGVSVGWGWGEEDAGGGAYPQPFFFDTPTTARRNLIEHNHIHHVMLSHADGGGIYTLSNQPDSVIRGNHIHDNPGAPGGIYLDEGSGFFEVTENLVYRVPTAMNYNNRAQNRIATVREHDNFFGLVSEGAAFAPGTHGKAPEMPGAARSVMDEAGLEPAWRRLLEGRSAR